MIQRFSRKYFIILIVEFIILVILKGFLPDLAFEFKDYDKAIDLILYLSDSVLPIILNIIIATFLVIDLNYLKLENKMIPLLALINPIPALCLFGLLILNNDYNTNEKWTK